jgi:hypothetical protein
MKIKCRRGFTEQYGSNEQHTLDERAVTELHTNCHAQTVIRSNEAFGRQATGRECYKGQRNEEQECALFC